MAKLARALRVVVNIRNQKRCTWGPRWPLYIQF